MDRGYVAFFSPFMDTSLRVTSSSSQTVSLGLRNTLHMVESGSGYDGGKISGSSVKRQKAFVARVKMQLDSVETPKPGNLTRNIDEVLERMSQGLHPIKRMSRASTDGALVNQDILIISRAARPPRNLSRRKKLYRSRLDSRAEKDVG